jgi:hypothetical protein
MLAAAKHACYRDHAYSAPISPNFANSGRFWPELRLNRLLHAFMELFIIYLSMA